MENDRRSDVLAITGMRDRESSRFGHRRMAQECMIDLARRNLLATAIDQLG